MNRSHYDQPLMRVILFASIIIVLSIAIVGTVVYLITQKEVVYKLKTQDLVTIAQSISARIDNRINRAVETSLILANDPIVMEWVKSGETKTDLQRPSLEKIAHISEAYDYGNTFIVSAVTNRYWSEDGIVIDTMSENDPDDVWFFNKITSKQRVSLEIDYNEERQDTFVFVNALMGELSNPLAVVGVGLSLDEIADYFNKYKFGTTSNLWLIDAYGEVYLSNRMEDNGYNLRALIPADISESIIEQIVSRNVNGNVLEYENSENKMLDLISYPIPSTNWFLVYQIERDETVAFLKNIKINTIFGSLLSFLFVIFFFYIVVRYYANPYKRAVQINQELEGMVKKRTEELVDKNKKLTDSIEYAKRIQEAILPKPEEMDQFFREYFILWKPRDVVGGDFYWVKKVEKGYLVAVCDCTGHGVPGALMTMITFSNLNYIVEQECDDHPGFILQRLNQRIKANLHQEHQNALTDDGVDIGLIYINGNKLIFSGAKIALFVHNAQGVKVFKGNRKSIGYRRTFIDYPFANHEIELTENDRFYITTDGYVDQNGGPKGYSLGTRRFMELLNEIAHLPLQLQGEAIQAALHAYMGEELQRDDITVLGFRSN